MLLSLVMVRVSVRVMILCEILCVRTSSHCMVPIEVIFIVLGDIN